MTSSTRIISKQRDRKLTNLLWFSKVWAIFCKKMLGYAKIMNNEGLPNFSFQEKFDYERTLNYKWPNERH